MEVTYRRRRTGRLATLSIAALMLATCVGSSSTATGAPSRVASTSTSTAGGDSTPTSVGGPSGAPIKVGYMPVSTGAIASAGLSTGATAGAEYVNTQLGGIGGRPLEVVTCDTDGTPEKAIACANTFVEDGVVAVLDGYNTSSSAALPALTDAHIPLVGMIPYDVVTGSSADNRVYFAAPQASYIIGALQGFKNLGAESLTLALVDTPMSHQVIDLLLPVVAKALDIKAKGVYFAATNPNFTALAATLAQGNPDIAGLMASPSEQLCTDVVDGLRRLNYKGTIFTAACTDFVTADRAKASGAALYGAGWLPLSYDNAPAAAQAQLDIAATAMAKVKGGVADYLAYSVFSLFVDFATGLTAAAASGAKLDGPAVLMTLKSLKDFPSFLGPNLTCGSATSPNCTTEMMLFQVLDNGTIRAVGDGYITPPHDILALVPGAT